MSVRPPFSRVPVEQAWAWTDALVPVRRTQSVSTTRAAGQVLAAEVTAVTDLPQRARVAIDGFAVAASATVGASDYSPLLLGLVEADRFAAGQACRVCSGDVLPDGADAVLPEDAADVFGATLEVSAALAGGSGVIAAGEECRAGQPLLPAGRPIRPQDLGLLAQAGVDAVTVRERPRVRVLLAGRYERDAAAAMLRPLIARDGGAWGGVVPVPDADSLDALLREPAADLLILVGGSGLAAGDHSVAGLARSGSVAIYGVAMHPGDTLALGRAGETPVVVLPGTPLACFCSYELVAARAVRRLAGLSPAGRAMRIRLPLARKIASSLGRVEMCRVAVVDGQAVPRHVAEDRLLNTVVQADGYVRVPELSEGYAAGSEVEVTLFDAPAAGESNV